MLTVRIAVESDTGERLATSIMSVPDDLMAQGADLNRMMGEFQRIGVAISEAYQKAVFSGA